MPACVAVYRDRDTRAGHERARSGLTPCSGVGLRGGAGGAGKLRCGRARLWLSGCVSRRRPCMLERAVGAVRASGGRRRTLLLVLLVLLQRAALSECPLTRHLRRRLPSPRTRAHSSPSFLPTPCRVPGTFPSH